MIGKIISFSAIMTNGIVEVEGRQYEFPLTCFVADNHPRCPIPGEIVWVALDADRGRVLAVSGSAYEEQRLYRSKNLIEAAYEAIEANGCDCEYPPDGYGDCLACRCEAALKSLPQPPQPPVKTRPSWDQYFIDLAVAVSKRSTCNRKQVGCILVRDKRIVSTGYAGSPPGAPHCLDVGCDIDPETGGCRRTIHAEANALANVESGKGRWGCTAYCTLSPCPACFQQFLNFGIERIVYLEEYRIPPRFDHPFITVKRFEP